MFHQKILLNLLIMNPELTTSLMAEKLGVSRKTISLRLRGLKEKRIIEPSVAQLAEYIKSEFSDAEIVYGKTEDNYKVLIYKKHY